MKVYGLIGYPLGHSFSQKYFTEKFLQLGITNCRYELFPLQSAGEFNALLQGNPGLCGLNVTIPYKKDIIAFLDDVSHLPKGVTACNCIKIMEGKRVGYNTDVVGFEASLASQLQPFHTKALVLGNGGAADAVRFVLYKLGISFKTVGRMPHNGSDITYSDLTENIIREHLLIINTTPLGTYPNINECPAIPYQSLTPQHYLYDLVYNPAETVFLKKGAEKGSVIKNGYEMLVLQAEESWRIWNS